MYGIRGEFGNEWDASVDTGFGANPRAKYREELATGKGIGQCDGGRQESIVIGRFEF